MGLTLRASATTAASFTFGDRGNLAELQVIWPTLERYKEFQTAAPREIAEWIKQGKTVVAAGPNSAFLAASQREISRLTIRSIKPLYLCAGIMENQNSL